MTAKTINRREFIVRSVGGLAGLSLAGTFTQAASGAIFDKTTTATSGNGMIDLIPLGSTGLKAPRLAMGTGTVGGGRMSNQTRLGREAFNRMFRHGYERGLRFADTAETYGTMPFVGEAMKGLPRENLTLLSKMWTSPDGSERLKPVRPQIEEYLQWFGTDYVDILLMHCMESGDWNTSRTHFMEGFSRAKEEGLARSVGISCHSLDAIRTAATEPWVDVIMVRINPFGTHVDGSVEGTMEAIKLARENGKGVIGMKIFGEGRHIKESEREQSIRFAIRESGINSMTIGFESIAQMDDAIDRVVRISSER
jgi:aryl-alcohol dehydrogenase-like predicted oxidoreductase